MKDRTRSFEAKPDVIFTINRAKQLRQAIADVEPTQETIDFRALWIGILNCAIEDFYSVMVGAEESVSLMAWGCRNLLEMRVVTLFALGSQRNAEDIIADSVIDGKEFFEAFSAYQRITHAQLIEETRSNIQVEKDEEVRQVLQRFLENEIAMGVSTTPLDTQANDYRERLIKMGRDERARPKMSGEMAKKVGLKAPFDALNRLLSKVVHRTSLSIAASLQKDSLAEALPTLSTFGQLNLLYIVIAIEGHFSVNGVIWPSENGHQP